MNLLSRNSLGSFVGNRLWLLRQPLECGWFTERFHRNALVTHFQHGQVFCAARRRENYTVTRCRLHQRAPQRRHPTDVVAVEIDLVPCLRCSPLAPLPRYWHSEQLPRRMPSSPPALLSELPGPPLPRLQSAWLKSECAHRSAAAAVCCTDSRRFHCDRRCWQPTPLLPPLRGDPW